MKKILLIASISFLFLGIQGCTQLEDFGDTNLNPAATSEPTLSALLSNVQSGIGGYAASTLRVCILSIFLRPNTPTLLCIPFRRLNSPENTQET